MNVSGRIDKSFNDSSLQHMHRQIGQLDKVKGRKHR